MWKLSTPKLRFHQELLRAPTLKANGKPLLKCIEYLDSTEQTGWSIDLVKGGQSSCIFICSVCRGLPKYPVELRGCGCVFCYDCINSVIKACSIHNNIPCPNCKGSFYMEQVQHIEAQSLALYRLFTAIDVRCSYGCGVIKGARSLIEHEMWHCKKRPVTCPNGCALTLPDSEMDVHLDVCDRRLVCCNKCHLPKLLGEKKHACVKALTETIKRMLYLKF